MRRWTTVLVCSGQLYREGLERLLKSPKFVLVTSVRSLNEFLSREPNAPDLLILGFDHNATNSEPLRVAASAKTSLPETRIVLLTQAADSVMLHKAASMGLHGVLSLDISGMALQRSLELVMLGQQVFPAPDVLRPPEALPIAVPPAAATIGEVKAPPPPAVSARNRRIPLSHREDQILQRLIAGAPNKVIARDLGITEGTVKVHVKSLCRKLGAANRTQAAIYGAEGIPRTAEQEPAPSRPLHELNGRTPQTAP